MGGLSLTDPSALGMLSGLMGMGAVSRLPSGASAMGGQGMSGLLPLLAMYLMQHRQQQVQQAPGQAFVNGMPAPQINTVPFGFGTSPMTSLNGAG